MADAAQARLIALSGSPEAAADSAEYLRGRLTRFLKRQERVLLCFPDRGPGSFGQILEQAVRAAGGIPMLWGPDLRWKALLRQAFASKATALIGPPMVILGLAKLSRAERIPLFVRNVLLAGYPCLDWMAEGIQQVLDCRIWICYAPGAQGVVAGFGCDRSQGIHLRQEKFDVRIVDERNQPVAPGEMGEVFLISREAPRAFMDTMERARLETAPCHCGDPAPRLVDLCPGRLADPQMEKLTAEILCWTSVLDCFVRRGEYGLEMELITFPGEKLPRLPTCAKKIVRDWQPDRDMPLWISPGWKKRWQFAENC